MATIHFNPMDPAFVADPYDFYRKLREHSPVHFEQALPGWLLSRYEHVSKFMGDPKLINPAPAQSLSTRLPAAARGHLDQYTRSVYSAVFYENPPQHTRQRGVLGSVFRPSVFEERRPLVQALADELVSMAADKSHIEFMHQFAYPMSAGAIMRLLGLPANDTDQIISWTTQLLHATTRTAYGVDPVATSHQISDMTAVLLSYVADAVQERRRRPGPDLLSALIGAGDATGRLSDEELIANVLLLLVTTINKTACHLGAAMLALLRHPDQLRDLHEHPDIATSAADELLRFESPVQIAEPQVVAETFEVDGCRLDRGQWVYLLLGSANRDPARFPDPDRLNLRRPPGRHIGFGVGRHNCLGAGLARIVGQEVFPRLAGRFPDMMVDPDQPPPAFQPIPLVRALGSLPLLLTVSVPARRRHGSIFI